MPALFSSQPPTVIRIETTRPTFLLFGTDWAQPACVAQIGPGETLDRLHAILSILHRSVPDLVPASIACVQWNGEQHLHVQAGLPGLPWFRLRDQLRTAQAWTDLEVKAGRALQRLHSAIAARTEWRGHVLPAEELLRQIELLPREGELPSHTADALQTHVDTLRALGGIDWFWQHGDFCVNNLLVGPTNLGIIDFEEFGETSVPLHDEIGLGLSIAEFASSDQDVASIRQYIRLAVEPTIERRPELLTHLRALVVHHLVWRINRCGERPRRRAVRARLAAILADFVAAPPAGAGNFLF